MTNEKYTESITLREMGCDIGENDFGCVFPQGAVSERYKVEELLKKAGGKPKYCDLNCYDVNSKGKGKPEYIITFNDDHNTLIVVECKRSIKFHETEKQDKPSDYSVDGVLYYTKFLKEEYNIIAIAVSGTKRENLKVSTFYWPKGQENYKELKKTKNIILEPNNYIKLIQGQKLKKSYSLDEIRITAIDMHKYLREIKMTEKNKPIFIAGILIALENDDFIKNYQNLTSYDLILSNLATAIENVLKSAEIEDNRIHDIKQVFTNLKDNTKFRAIKLGENQSITWYIEQLELKIKPMMDYSDSTLDALGIFYNEFIKYTGGDGKGLGIVLTPQHLTEFMVEVSGVNKSSRVVDICCGSASFLITSMARMFQDANPKEIEKIRRDQLYGVEFDNDLYLLAVANMIIRKDGKSNIDHGDCFDEKITNKLKEKDIHIGLINPPYSQDDVVELEFLERLLSILTTGGTGVCVVPVSCAIGTKFQTVRERLFDKHTLKAVFSMPKEIFYPTGVVTCVMVWEAHKPHDSNQETFFGFYRDDGFSKRKNLGRIDCYNKWQGIKQEWLSLYRNRDIKIGCSVRQCVTHKDEWLAEAYMETDYSELTKQDFIDTMKQHVAYQFFHEDK